MKSYKFIVAGLAALLFSQSALADLRVFACEPTWAALAKQIGADHVHVDSATTAFQDVHYIQARPSLISKVRRADLVVCSGAQLEIGWLPVLLRQASNAKVQPGQPGYLEAAQQVQRLEIPTSVDRAEGDIHPDGNPHVQTDPRNIAKVAAVLVQRMKMLDPDQAAFYQQHYDAFAARWQKAIAGWEQRAAPLKGMEIVTHHTGWIYMAHWLGLKVVGHLEPKPGVPPTAAHLAELLDQLKQDHLQAIIRASYQDERPSDWLSKRTGAPAIVIPHTVGATDGAKDLFGMFDDMISKLLAAEEGKR